ncbi:MAG: RNA 2',3'-cyclic phosphodiesterase [Candidatus Doudnabacteria bacterium]|nr:RNA 2',3'-cyclic phosphodiesterase [Candidatus Doudnabacteria bacterium]
MRVFTAIPLPKHIKDKFAEISRGKLPIPYVNTTNLHITLNFLGELDSVEYKSVNQFWTKDLPLINKLDIKFDKLVKFRQQIHMTLVQNTKLRELREMLQKHFESQGYKFTHSNYYPHVTIGNLHMDKVMYKDRKIERFPNNELEQLSFTADRIVLYESKLLLHHAHHTELAEHKLS